MHIFRLGFDLIIENWNVYYCEQRLRLQEI